jgi:hypothetical protein
VTKGQPNEIVGALAELQALFLRANRRGCPPHILDPEVFSRTWSVLKRQPFEVRIREHKRLVDMLTNPRLNIRHVTFNEDRRPD